jgi:hypothetical protein
VALRRIPTGGACPFLGLVRIPNRTSSEAFGLKPTREYLEVATVGPQ